MNQMEHSESQFSPERIFTKDGKQIHCDFFPFSVSDLSFVFKGWDDQSIVIKVLLDTVPDPEILENRKNVLKSIEHPHIVPVYHVFISNTQVCIEMPYLEGYVRLEERIKEGTVELSLVENVVDALSDVVIYLDTQNKVHTDLKPSNILIGSEGEVMIIDPDSIEQKKIPISMLTAKYIPPELDKEWNERGMVYVIGKIIEDMTGTAGIKKEANLSSVIEKATQDYPELRYATVEELHTSLKEAVSKKI